MKCKGENRMKLIFLCTDNYTRSITAELCMIVYLERTENTNIVVSSAGFKVSSDLSRFSAIHFKRMEDLGVNTSTFKRTQFQEHFLTRFDVIVGMGK